MRKLNQDGPPLLGVPEPPALTVEAFDRIRSGGIHILDTRSPERSPRIFRVFNAVSGPAFRPGPVPCCQFANLISVVERSRTFGKCAGICCVSDMACRWAACRRDAEWRSYACRSQRCPMDVWDLKDEMERKKSCSFSMSSTA